MVISRILSMFAESIGCPREIAKAYLSCQGVHGFAVKGYKEKEALLKVSPHLSMSMSAGFCIFTGVLCLQLRNIPAEIHYCLTSTSAS